MSTQQQTDLTVQKALNILKEFSCIQIKTVETEAEKEQLRQALLLITNLSEHENLGICADNAIQGFAALSSYLQALGYDVSFDRASISSSNEPVYIKFNTQRMAHFVDSYTGSYRGVLVSCQSENDILVGTYGHLPLDLFR
ncbi:MAG: DUF1824 family protein [Microcystaceae cyanobacterium]